MVCWFWKAKHASYLLCIIVAPCCKMHVLCIMSLHFAVLNYPNETSLCFFVLFSIQQRSTLAEMYLSLYLCFCLVGCYPSHFMFLPFGALEPSQSPSVPLFLSHTDTQTCCCCIAVGCKYWVPAWLSSTMWNTVFVFLYRVCLHAKKDKEMSNLEKGDNNCHSVSLSVWHLSGPHKNRFPMKNREYFPSLSVHLSTVFLFWVEEVKQSEFAKQIKV